jgi:FkbM family methyltransferase
VQSQPAFLSLDENILKFDWTESSGYFAYPLEVSSSVYRTKDLINMLRETDFRNPNTLESEMAKNRNRYVPDKKYLLCYNKSAAFCNPANVVQDVFAENRRGNSKEYSSDNLANLFDEGFVIDVHKYNNLLPESCHKEVNYDFIKVIDGDSRRLSNIKIYYETQDIEQLGFDNSNSEINGEAALLPHLIEPGDVVFDVGANQGEWSRKILDIQPGVSLYAFEPVESTFKTLQKNMAGSKADIFNIALSKRSGKKTFYHYSQSSQSARMSTFYRRNSVEEDLNIQPVAVQINTKSLSSFCKSHGIDKIDFLKIDTEGAELDVLKGAASLLQSDKIETIQFEYGGTYTDAGITLKEICALLMQCGYIIFRILPDGLAYIPSWHDSLENYRYSNYLAVSRQTLKDHLSVNKAFFKTCESHEKDYPLVSIYMAVYNSGKYLAQTLNSILNQTFQGFELVIADDGSTDGSLNILKQYAYMNKRIKILKLKHSGVVNARNKAIKKCNPKSKYLINHDSDDISLPDKIERLVEYLEIHPEISVAGCFAEYFDEEGIIKGQPPIEWKPEKIRETFGSMNSMIHSASLMRREVVEKIGGYSKEFPAAQDYDFFSRILMEGFEMANIPEVLHRIRLHPESIGRLNSQLQDEMAKKVQLNYNDHLKERASKGHANCVNSFLVPLLKGEKLQLLLNISRDDKADFNAILKADAEIAKTNEESCRNLIKNNNSEGFPHMWLGLVLWNNCKYAEAWKEFDAAEALGAPKWRTSWYKSLIIRDNHSKWGWQNYELARELVSEVILLRPEFENAKVFQLYLNGYYSQWGQDVLIEDFFDFNPPQYNFFVDVGAYDGITLSNTYHFSKTGWDGLCVEPVSENYDKLLSTHKDSGIKCIRTAVSMTEGEVLISIQGTGSAISDSENSNTEKVMSAKLSTILDSNNIENIDLLSIDAEERDFEVLQSIDLNKFSPKLIVIEYNSITSEKTKMIEYLNDFGYSLWHDNVQDLFFRKEDTVAPPNFWHIKTLNPTRASFTVDDDRKG